MSALRSDPIIPPLYAHPALELLHRQLVLYGLCFLRGGSRIVDARYREIVAVAPGASIAGDGRDDPNGKRVVTTSYSEIEATTRRDWLQSEIDAARSLHARVLRLPIQRSLVVQVFYACEYAEVWTTLSSNRQQTLLHELTHWPRPPRGVNARIDDHNRERGDHVPHIVHELFPMILHRATRELLARERGTLEPAMLPRNNKPQNVAVDPLRNTKDRV
jgi:hypothetical protein